MSGQIFEIDQEKIDKANRESAICYKVLNQRYSECNDEGHKDPNAEQNNYCTHCYRHLVYKTPRTDAILQERKKLPSYQQPLDAPVMIERANSEKESQKFKDICEGVTKIRQELQESGELEELLKN